MSGMTLTPYRCYWADTLLLLQLFPLLKEPVFLVVWTWFCLPGCGSSAHGTLPRPPDTTANRHYHVRQPTIIWAALMLYVSAVGNLVVTGISHLEHLSVGCAGMRHGRVATARLRIRAYLPENNSYYTYLPPAPACHHPARLTAQPPYCPHLPTLQKRGRVPGHGHTAGARFSAATRLYLRGVFCAP